MKFFRLLFLILFFLEVHTVQAWVYPEHRQIAIMAIQELQPDYRNMLNGLWQEARAGYENRLTENVIDIIQGRDPKKLDYASWFAIAGDHSNSPVNMLQNVLLSQWILQVADIAAELKIDLENANTPTKYLNAIRESDIRLQKADFEYATRANSNNAHFLLARTSVKTTIGKYLENCYKDGMPLNAFGVYAIFHTSALIKAARYAGEHLTREEKSELLLTALADEAFAQHFLEDAFAAGHAAGTHGNTSVRKGTHDYYNEHGLEVVTWSGERMVLMGDAYMSMEYAEVAAATIKKSLIQFLDVASGKKEPVYPKDSATLFNLIDTFSICKNNFNPLLIYDSTYLKDILVETPVPGLVSVAGEFPRFRSEIGKFIGVTTSINGSVVFSGFGIEQHRNGFIPGLEAGIRYGFGLDGVLNRSGDGLVFLQVGWKIDGTSSNQYADEGGSTFSNNITSAIPSRSAFTARIRLPFYLIPGDLLLLGPILMLTSPDKLTKVGGIAAGGGLIPWQSAIATPIGRFQFVLGREVGISLYGLTSPKTLVFINVDTSTTLVTYKSIQFEFPVLEYRPFRTYSLDQSSSLIMQFTAGFDIPYGALDLATEVKPNPPLRTVWQIGVRFLFNWRHYY